MKQKLKPKEKLFCVCFVGTGNAEQAAKRAGYRGDCRLKGERLLCEEKILAELERLASLRRRALSGLAEAGYYRLAFGGVSDAMQLLYTDKPSAQQLKEMDLFMISEIKKPKDGMLEIKFFDRLKALEKLGAPPQDAAGVAGLFDAIGKGAQAAGGDPGD